MASEWIKTKNNCNKKRKSRGNTSAFFFLGFISVALSIIRTVATKRAIKIATKFTGIKKTLVL